MKKIFFAVVSLIAVVAPCSAVELSFEGDFPIVGRAESITVEGTAADAGLQLWVVYSPSSETSSEEEIGVVPITGKVAWTPSRFGIATVSLRGADGAVVAAENVAILFAKPPMAGVVVMIFAGLLLFGGAGFSLRSVLRSGVPEHGSPIDT